MTRYSNLVLGYLIRNFKLKIKNSSKGFTLIELLVVISIIGILIGVLVPSMSRSLSGNRLANDVEVLRAKLEETRLLAGSTQTNDDQTILTEPELPNTDKVGYYGIYIPPSDILLLEPNKQFYAIVRVSSPLTQHDPGYCEAAKAASDALAGTGACLIERINLTNNVTFNAPETYNARHRIIGFRVPSQQTTELYCQDPCGTVNGHTNSWQENPHGPVFDQGVGEVYFKLKYGDKIATIRIEPYTGKLKVEYSNG